VKCGFLLSEDAAEIVFLESLKAMLLTYYGHACFSVQLAGKTLLFDPFISPNPLAAHIDVKSIRPDYILVSHGHFDHIADLVSIGAASKATIICAWEIHEWLQEQGIQSTLPMNTGGIKELEAFSVRCVVAQHSSSLPGGRYGGNPMGFVISSPEGNLYYSGDTALTTDMQLIPLWNQLDVALLPIGNQFTMGVEDAMIAANWIKCSTIIGVHYNTFDAIQIDTAKARAAFAAKGLNLLLPSPGNSLEFKNQQ
jgi:L-ascorbate metabolism protein UlaG (beta-lactamase superfamily)